MAIGGIRNSTVTGHRWIVQKTFYLQRKTTADLIHLHGLRSRNRKNLYKTELLVRWFLRFLSLLVLYIFSKILILGSFTYDVSNLQSFLKFCILILCQWEHSISLDFWIWILKILKILKIFDDIIIGQTPLPPSSSIIVIWNPPPP